ncbi:MAG: hypothetical protein ABWK05_01940 [Pyrobaculum sp.]
MNLTTEVLASLAVLAVGIYLIQKLRLDIKLINIFKQYPIPNTIKSGGIIDLDKLKIFIQNFSYRIDKRGSVEFELSGDVVKVVSGEGEFVIYLEAWGQLDYYKVARVVKVAP